MGKNKIIWSIINIPYYLLIIYLAQNLIVSIRGHLPQNYASKTFSTILIAEAEPSLPQTNYEAYEQRVQQWREQQSNQQQRYQDIRKQQQEQFQQYNDFRRQQQEQISPPEPLLIQQQEAIKKAE